MSVKFTAASHYYESIAQDDINWVSVTTFIGSFKGDFNARQMAQKASANKRSKWYGLPVEEILLTWNAETKRSTDLGTWYHLQQERNITNMESVERNGSTLKVICPIYENGIKYAPDQKLVEAVYPEHFVYLKSAGICGQADMVEIVDGTVNIIDYKTSKEIKLQGFKSWEGISKKLLRPLSHLDDCNYNHYTLQLSIYLYIILKHNPQYKPGKLTLHHVLFEELGRDKFDHPIYKADETGNFIVKEVVTYDLPYLKQECISLINWLKDSKSKTKLKAA
jgi:hypothetical protein